jgi:hypothetical protein
MYSVNLESNLGRGGSFPLKITLSISRHSLPSQGVGTSTRSDISSYLGDFCSQILFINHLCNGILEIFDLFSFSESLASLLPLSLLSVER